MIHRMRLLHVVGARPNFPKLAPVFRAARLAGSDQAVVHTGQHYDSGLSGDFFRDLDIPEPDFHLEVGSGSHALQTGRVMERIEPVISEQSPDWLVTYGDVNSTMAAALVASKLGVRIAHVEAGLRSGDRSMPEEINRLVTDRLSHLLLTPSRDASEALRREGEDDSRIVFVGNVMIDSLFHARLRARATSFSASQGLNAEEAVVVTLHRPSNVDDGDRLVRIAETLRTIARHRPVIFPCHPRTAAALRGFGVDLGAVRLLPPVSYFEMLDLVDRAFAVVTDSGGLQEETTALGVPCFTLRPNTERPITITEGTNTLVPEPESLVAMIESARRPSVPLLPEGWDGHAAERVVAALRSFRPSGA